MRQTLALIIILACSLANADDLAFHNEGHGTIVITDEPCNVAQIQALFFSSNSVIRFAYATDAQDNIITRGCWDADRRSQQVRITWEDWSTTAVKSDNWTEFDEISSDR